jgi:hypothetical protein
VKPEVFVPFPYQEEMIEFAEGRECFSLFASPGLGKTPVTLHILAERMAEGNCRGTLIVAPLRVTLITWPTQVARWAHSHRMRCVNLRTPEGRKAWADGTADIYLINPEMLPKLLPGMMEAKKLPVDTLVIDELSVFKSHSSVRAKLLAKHAHRFPRRIGLTGTPVPNTYLDLFQQIKVIDGGERLGKSFHHFQRCFFESDFMGYKWTIRPGAKETIDAKIADICLVMLGDDYLDVPTCTVEDIEVALPQEAKAAYKTLEKELLISLKKSDVVAPSAATLVGKLLQITGGAVYGEDGQVNHVHDAKIEALRKLRKKHGKEPMLVLTSYKHEMARILEAIPGARKFHEDDMGEWQAGKIHTWVADPRSMSHGIDGIQKGGRIAVWMTLTWSNESYIQTNARIVRTGQSQESVIYRIVCPGTVDDAVAEALREKSNTQSGLLNALKALQALRA